MKTRIVLLFLVFIAANLKAQPTWSGATPGNIFYNSGDVGIGTSPAGTFGEKLHIYSTSNTGLKVDRGGTVSGSFLAYSNSILVGSVSNHPLILMTNSGTTMTLRPNGNVGIGTDDPSTRVESAGAITINPSVATNNYLLFKTNGTSLGVIGSDASISGGNPSNFGMYAYGNNNLEFWTNSGKRLTINGSGNVGIGTDNPQSAWGEKLHIYSTSNTGLKVERGNGVFGSFLAYSNEVIVGSGSNHQLSLMTGGSTRMIIKESGNVGIGMTDPAAIDSKLTVAGDIHSREVRVTVSAGSDFVFHENYDLRTLTDVEKFIRENKHLPDVAPAKEMEENGIELGKMDMKLLQKIEELTLYMIDFKKEMDKMKAENQKLKDRIIELEKD